MGDRQSILDWRVERDEAPAGRGSQKVPASSAGQDPSDWNKIFGTVDGSRSEGRRLAPILPMAQLKAADWTKGPQHIMPGDHLTYQKESLLGGVNKLLIGYLVRVLLLVSRENARKSNRFSQRRNRVLGCSCRIGERNQPTRCSFTVSQSTQVFARELFLSGILSSSWRSYFSVRHNSHTIQMPPPPSPTTSKADGPTISSCWQTPMPPFRSGNVSCSYPISPTALQQR